MKFDDLDANMRAYETASDQFVAPGVFMVARLDGRGFTRLTKDVHPFEAPFDERFRDLMLDTAEALLVEFPAVYAYTQSDEISLLFPADCGLFNRKLRKLNSVLAGFASARFALGLGSMASMDCRICELPTAAVVVDYFRWRAEDAHRNALNAHCYWLLRGQGLTGETAAARMHALSITAKVQLLADHGIHFDTLPGWQKRGSGLYWQVYAKSGTNPLTGETTTTDRRQVVRDLRLPVRDAYAELIRGFVISAKDS